MVAHILRKCCIILACQADDREWDICLVMFDYDWQRMWQGSMHASGFPCQRHVSGMSENWRSCSEKHAKITVAAHSREDLGVLFFEQHSEGSIAVA